MEQTNDLFSDVFETNKSKAAVKSYKDDWSEGCKLLFQSGYLKVVKEMAISGQLQQYNIRSVCWRLFLGILPEDKSKWADAVKKSREKFSSIKSEHIVDPHSSDGGKDLAVHNPLSLADDSPWNQYFQDNDLKVVINQDVVRTFPDVQFFRQPEIQTMLVDLLFCYSREHEELGYRQGMHEILAPIVFVMHAELREPNDPSLAPELQNVLDPKYVEHDTYAIFSELMESVGPWYMSTALEADFYRARAQSRKKMSHDPRTNKPFQDTADFAPTSAISRKLGVIHNLHLKNADDVLYTHLKNLSIPPQTYGIRWIRLLFGREFPLPTVLELWDALFADGPSLGLVDYMCVAMLMHIRDVLTKGDYATCMQYLMRFPPVYEVNYLVQRSLHLRNPTQFPSPRIWSHSPAAANNLSLGSTASINNSDSTQQAQLQTKPLTKASVKQGLKQLQTHLNKIPTRGGIGGKSGPRLEFHPASKSGSRSPSPDHTPTVKEHPLQLSGEVPPRKGRGRIIGSVKQSPSVEKTSQEMSENPKSTPLADTGSSQVDKLSNRVDDLQAKCLYCGGKTETIISALQDEILKLEGLSPDTENTLLLSLAGLKHVRDLLLNKIPFSGEATGFDEIIKSAKQQLEDSQGSGVNLDTPSVDHMTVTKNRSDREPSLEVGTEVTVDDQPSEEWVSVTTEDTHPLEPHPLATSGD